MEPLCVPVCFVRTCDSWPAYVVAKDTHADAATNTCEDHIPHTVAWHMSHYRSSHAVVMARLGWLADETEPTAPDPRARHLRLV